MKYCSRCLYPENARPTIFIDDEGVCSGCRNHERESEFDWEDREKALKKILEEYKSKPKDPNQLYDCIIPVSGGKDSHYQVHLAKNVYGLNP
jgi:tRNA(Ile)-lysidine synthase TilS/MesJ